MHMHGVAACYDTRPEAGGNEAPEATRHTVESAQTQKTHVSMYNEKNKKQG